MRTVGRHIRRRDMGASCALCDVCGARFSRRQLVRGRDGFLRCSGPGTFNDAKGKTAMELDEMVSARSAEHASGGPGWDDPGAIDSPDIVVP